VISVAHEAGNNNDLRVILGNDVAIKAYCERKLPYPDGTIIARMAWSYVPSEESNKVFGRAQSFVAGPPINLQLLVKDSGKYASTGGWGFAQFKDGKPADEAVHKTCFPCHEPAKARDFVYTRYSSSPGYKESELGRKGTARAISICALSECASDSWSLRAICGETRTD